MAQYTAPPQGYMLADEKEYLQAYEDVLEKYKGRTNGRLRDVVFISQLTRREVLDSPVFQYFPPSMLVEAGQRLTTIIIILPNVMLSQDMKI